MQAQKNDTAVADEKIAELERELLGTQEMLAFVLASVGEPVVVTKESLAAGLPPNLGIEIIDDMENQTFVFQLIEANDE